MRKSVADWIKDIKLPNKVHPKMMLMLLELQYFLVKEVWARFAGNMHNVCWDVSPLLVGLQTTKYAFASWFRSTRLATSGPNSLSPIEESSRLDKYQNSKYWETSACKWTRVGWCDGCKSTERLDRFMHSISTQKLSVVDSLALQVCLWMLLHQTILQYHKTHRIVLLASCSVIMQLCSGGTRDW